MEGICKRCKADKNCIKMFSRENNMNPGVLPETLHELTLIEQQLIARISPCMHVYMLKHGGIASTGHCVTFPQEVNEPAKIFPRLPHEIDIIKVTRHGRQNTSKDFKVSRKKVQNALIWLKENNPAYIDITISEKRLLCLPIDGELSDKLVAEINENIKITNDRGPAPEQFDNLFNSDCTSASGVLFPDQGINVKKKLKKWCEKQ